jgi:hypothetical protein
MKFWLQKENKTAVITLALITFLLSITSLMLGVWNNIQNRKLLKMMVTLQVATTKRASAWPLDPITTMKPAQDPSLALEHVTHQLINLMLVLVIIIASLVIFKALKSFWRTCVRNSSIIEVTPKQLIVEQTGTDVYLQIESRSGSIYLYWQHIGLKLEHLQVELGYRLAKPHVHKSCLAIKLKLNFAEIKIMDCQDNPILLHTKLYLKTIWANKINSYIDNASQVKLTLVSGKEMQDFSLNCHKKPACACQKFAEVSATTTQIDDPLTEQNP